MSRGYALFDLDHTLLPHDTQVLFCNFVLRREGWRRVYLLWFLPLVPLAALRLVSLRTMKRLFSSYLVGMSQDQLEQHVDDFLESDFEASLYESVVAEVERHRDEGRLLILNSASPEFYVKGVARKLGFDHFIGTDVECRDPMTFFPNIPGANNKHEVKVKAMVERELIPQAVIDEEVILPDSWGYSDSSADIPLLSIVEHGVMIHPSENLDAVGQERDWRTMTPARPYDGKWGNRWSMLRQAFGLYRVGE